MRSERREAKKRLASSRAIEENTSMVAAGGNVEARKRSFRVNGLTLPVAWILVAGWVASPAGSQFDGIDQHFRLGIMITDPDEEKIATFLKDELLQGKPFCGVSRGVPTPLKRFQRAEMNCQRLYALFTGALKR
jgi:hypothetical protein